jgi:histidinol-phosphatase (PHP family)
MIRRGGFTVLGHADILRKRNGDLGFFDEADGWYQAELEATAREAGRAGVIVEINTGGIARGTLADTYPSADFLARFHKYGAPVMINSDAHHTSHLDAGFDIAEKRARDAGYKSTVYLTADGTIAESPL